MDNLGFGLSITVVGMGIVFGLLLLLWLVLVLVGRLDRRSAARDAASPAPVTEPAASRLAPAAAPVDGVAVASSTPRVRLVGDGIEPDLAAAITVAVLRHVETRRRQAAPATRSYWPGSLLFASRWVAAGRTRQGQSWTRRAR